MSRLNTMNLSMELLKNWRYGFNNATTTKPEYDPHHQAKVKNEPKATPILKIKAIEEDSEVEEKLLLHRSASSTNSGEGTPKTNSPSRQTKTPTKRTGIKANSSYYHTLMDVALVGLKLRQNGEAIRSMVLEKGDLDDSDPLTRVLAETQELNNELMLKISSLFGERTLGPLMARLDVLERCQSKSEKVSYALTERVAKLEHERGAQRRSLRNGSILADCSIADIHGDSDDEQKCSESVSRSDPCLRQETVDTINKIKATMLEHGLSANHVIWWTEQHQHDLSETMVHSFFSRRLKEEKYQQIIPLLQLFLEEACTPHWITESTFLSQETCDLIDHYRQTMKERGIPSNRFGKWLANNKGMKSVGHKISDFFTKKLPEARSRMLLEKLDDFLKERKERKEALRGLSPETIASIDDLKQQLDQLGHSQADLKKWLDSNHYAATNSNLTKFFLKKLTELKTREFITLIGQFLEDVKTPGYSLPETQTSDNTQEPTEIDKELPDPVETFPSSPDSECDDSTDGDEDETEGRRPKRMRMNHTFSAESLKVLNEAYDGDEKPSVESLRALSQQLNEPAKMIASWFRSRRFKRKRDE